MGRLQKEKRSHFFSVLCDIYISLLCSVFLLAFPLSGYGVMAVFKYQLFLVLSIGFVGLFAVAWAENRLISYHRPEPSGFWRRLGVQHLAVAYLVFTALSAALSKYPGTLIGNTRQEGLLTIALYVLCFLVLMRYFEPKRWMLFVFGGAVTLFCVLGIVQFCGANPFGLYPKGYNYYGADVYYPGKYWSTIGNSNLCAAVLALSAGGLSAVLIRRKGKLELLLIIPLILSVFSIFELQADAGVVAVAAGSLLILLFAVARAEHIPGALVAFGSIALGATSARIVEFYDGGIHLVFGTAAVVAVIAGVMLIVVGLLLARHPIQVSGKTIRTVIAVIVLAVAITGLLLLYLHDGFDGTLFEIHELLHGRASDDFGSGRLFIWRQVIAKVGEAPLFGGGPDTLSLRGLEGFERYNDALGTTVSSGVDTAHNEYLNILVNQGIFALLTYLALLGLSIVRCFRHTADDGAVIGGAAAIFYLVQAFFGISMCLTTPYLWAALAVINKNSTKERK